MNGTRNNDGLDEIVPVVVEFLLRNYRSNYDHKPCKGQTNALRAKSELNHLISAKLNANCVDFDMEI